MFLVPQPFKEASPLSLADRYQDPSECRAWARHLWNELSSPRSFCQSGLLEVFAPGSWVFSLQWMVVQREMKTQTCAWMSVAALFIIANTWRQPRCPLVSEWINKLWYIQTTEYYPMLKISELSSHEKTWKKLKRNLPSERSQPENLHIVWFQLYSFRKRQNNRDTKKINSSQEPVGRAGWIGGALGVFRAV